MPFFNKLLEQAAELVDRIDTLPEQDKRGLKASFPDLITDTPKTQVAALRVGKLMNKAEANFEVALKEILVGPATEGAKTVLKNFGMPF